MKGINIGGGQRINLRLRPPGSPDGFYEYDQLVLVMLHEVGLRLELGLMDSSHISNSALMMRLSINS
jgi:hypothetical protein